MEFDRAYLNQEAFVQQRLRRDASLRDLNVDPELFRQWQRQQEVDNECGSDEYRETQPSKGLTYIADFFADWAPGVDAVYEMMELVKKWLDAGANLGEAYSGADELVPILNNCFDFIWEQGGYSLYVPRTDLPDAAAVECYESPLAEGG